MSAPEEQPTVIELIELSDLAWTLINSDGEHDSIERAWTAALPGDWARTEGVDELRTRLSEITDRLRTTGDTALLEVVSPVIVYLAAHSDRRRVEQAVIGEALHEQYGDAVLEDIAAWPGRPRRPRGRWGSAAAAGLGDCVRAPPNHRFRRSSALAL